MLLSSNAISWINESDHQDGEDVELVCRVVIVQVVPGLSIGQPELVPQSQALAEMSPPAPLTLSEI